MIDGIDFRQDFGDYGMWWPAYDPHPQRNYDYCVRNSKDLEFTASLCRHRRVCVQAGGHAGIWPLKLAKDFNWVMTFEPDPELFACLTRNTRDTRKVNCFRGALSDATGMCVYERGPHAGSGRTKHGSGSVPMMTVDSFNLNNLDCLVLDIERHEPFALRGAERTIKRCWPVIHCEELPDAREEIHSILKSWGYRLVKNIHKDGIWAH